ncbi:MAG: ABC transporter ATP-binding protein [Oscillospiraceae bacterium]|nr:ABC transporter ATP-binding protein [Oscillospiraceae bacterium]
MADLVLEVRGLCKEYPGFRLEDVSFAVPRGCIMGFIGRNGAGKTTTLKSILGLVHSSAGEIRFFGQDLRAHETEIKRRIGYAGGAVGYYPRKKIRDFVAVTRKFYPDWDEEAYRRYMAAFELDEEKSPSQLSEGMKVKLSLCIALSHRAELLILDEPTSGLDPVSRDEVLEIFQVLRDKGISILFSTHITSDLDKCADAITYIRKGQVLASQPMASYVAACREAGIGSTLEEIMLHYEKEDFHEKLA